MRVVKNHGSWGPTSDCKPNSTGTRLRNLYFNKPSPLPMTPTRGQGWDWLDSNKGGLPAWIPQWPARSATLVSLHSPSRPCLYLPAGPVHKPLPGPRSPRCLCGQFLLIIGASTLRHLPRQISRSARPNAGQPPDPLPSPRAPLRTVIMMISLMSVSSTGAGCVQRRVRRLSAHSGAGGNASKE